MTDPRRRRRRAAAGVAVLIALAAAGCWRPVAPTPAPGGPEEAAGRAAPFDMEAFFAGSSVSIGSVDALFSAEEHFIAGFIGLAEAGRLRLDERFIFPDGERFQRWDLRRDGPDRYAGTVETELADGVLAEPVPVEGRRTADGVVLDYVGYAPGGGRLAFRFRHEMTANGDGTVRNHVTVSKFGIPLAVSDVVFAKTPQDLQVHLYNRPLER